MPQIQNPSTMEMVDVPEGGGSWTQPQGPEGPTVWQPTQGTHTVGNADEGYSQAANISGNALSTAQNAYSGLKSLGANSWLSPEGGIINLDPQTGASTYSPPASSYSATNRFGQNYGVSSLSNSPYSYNGQNIAISPTTAQIDPNTGKALSDANGQPLYYAVQDAGQGGNFWNENMMGALKVGAFALGASGLDAALGGAELGTGMVDASGNIIGGGSAGASVGSGLAGAGETVLPTTSYAGADSVLNAPNVQIPDFGVGMPSGASGGITAPLEGSGAIPGAGATTLGEGGLTGALPANVMVGDGTLGTTMGATYMSAAPGQFALDASGAAIPASSVGIGGFSPSTLPSISTSDVSNASKLAKALTSQAGSQLSSAAQNLATGQTGVGMALPNLVRGNQNPFAYTAQQPIRDAQPMDLNSLAKLLKQG